MFYILFMGGLYIDMGKRKAVLSEEEKKKRRKDRDKQWYNDNIEYAREYRREHYKKNKESRSMQMRAYHFKRKYGITLEEYYAMLEQQNNKCAICGNEETSKRRDTLRLLSVDHDHVTGKVRGLLCNGCNQLIGYFKEDISLLYSAMQGMIAYINKHRDG